MQPENEIWKDVPGYEGYYQVSNLGRVKSLERLLCNKLLCRPIKEKIKDILPNGNGYQFIFLYLQGKRKKFYIHRLVAWVFIPCEDTQGLEVNHKNKNRCHNSTDNLEWMTTKENAYHRDHYQEEDVAF